MELRITISMKLSIAVLFSLISYTFIANAQDAPSAPADSSDVILQLESKKSKKKNVENKAYVMRSQSYSSEVARLENGYTALDAGSYAIKDYLVKGEVNLICLTRGTSIASPGVYRGETFKKYYLQKKSEPSVYREVFIAQKSGTMSSISGAILGSSSDYRIK